ncbi:hypothetical protein CPB86DRAFT_703901 [Serendipita vermifera]|nr:hypothetical protein CPB86DRAFT_703901 [Serendipita vermifera]
MSEIDGPYGHIENPLSTLDLAYNHNQSRPPPTSALAPSRRPNRASYKPAMNPPPNIALPATPAMATSSSNGLHYAQNPLRASSQTSFSSGRGHSPISSHPYSAQSLASTPEIELDLSNGYSSANERLPRVTHRALAHTNGMQHSAMHSQAQPFIPNGRQASASSISSTGEHGYVHSSLPPRERSTAVSPGSYFAAYPPASSPTPRDRSNSATTGASSGFSSHSSPASVTPPTPGKPSSFPSHTHHLSSQSAPPQASSGSQPPNDDHSGSGPSHPHRTRPSSRRALTAALELAKHAVQLDATNDDPHGAVLAYAKSVQLLGEVMERVMRGEDSSATSSSQTSGAAGSGHTSQNTESEERRRGGRRRSVVAKEEEVRRLRAIHDTYADRMRVLCVIYSIPDPLTSGPSTGSTLPSSQHLLEEYESSIPPRPSRSQALPPGLPVHQQPPMQEIPEDVQSDDGIRDQDTATIRDERMYSDADKDWEVDSDWERRGLKRDRPRKQERQPDVTSLEQQRQQHQQQQLQALDEAIANATTPRATQTTMPDTYALLRSTSHDQIAAAATHVSATPTTLAGLRSSVLPPPRPPPTAPLPNRPRMASGASIPAQLLNQPLPPIPSTQPPESATHSIPSSNQAPTLARQSSSSSVSVISGISSNASGSSSASTAASGGLPFPTTTLPSASLAPAGLNTGSLGATSRPRGTSNAHARNASTAERLGALSEEKEEEENVPKPPVPTSTTPPQEYKYRSRSSSMVSLKDRDRAKAQVLGLHENPLPPVPIASSSSSTLTAATTVAPPTPRTPKQTSPDVYTPDDASVSSPGLTTFGPKITPRPRGASVGSSATTLSDDYITSGANSSAHASSATSLLPYTAGGSPGPSSAPIIIPGALGGSTMDTTVKISPSPINGTISQRRHKLSSTGPSPTQTPMNKLTSAVLPASTATSLGLTGRSRAASNPGKWPAALINAAMGDSAAARPPVPVPPMSAGPRRQFPGLTPKYQSFGIISPSASAVSLIQNAPTTYGATVAGAPSSMPPPHPPAFSVLRPYHLMILLRKSMNDRTGGFITPRLHVPYEVWTQGSTKLTNTTEKTKVIDILVAALDELTNASVDFCGASSEISMSTGGANNDRKTVEKWASKLEDFDRAFGQVAETFGKKLGVGGGFVVKKSVGMAAWSNKLFDKIAAAGKPYDSPMAYVNLLIRLFTQVQLLNEHTRALHVAPQPPCYTSLPQDVRTRIEASLKSISELFAKVVLTFVFRDLSLMLDKYHKTCDRWIQSNPSVPS